MSVSNSDANLVAWWNSLSDDFNRYMPIFIYIFGIIGNFINILVLSQRVFRSNPSAVFFVVTSIAGLIAIVSGLTSRMMAGYMTDLTLTVTWICIIRNYVLYTARTVALWMIAFATIDRWFSSNPNNSFRQKSNVKNTRLSIVIVLLGSCLVNAPIIFCYQGGLTGALRGCYGATYACRVITDTIYAVITTVSPLITMVIFGLLTVQNIRHTRNRIQNQTVSAVSQLNNYRQTNATGRQQTKRRDRYLLKMLFVQVTLLCLFTCGHALQKAYISIAAIITTATVQSAVTNFIFTILTLLNFTASGMPFYIYTLSGGTIFRNALFTLIKASARKILCQ